MSNKICNLFLFTVCCAFLTANARTTYDVTGMVPGLPEDQEVATPDDDMDDGVAIQAWLGYIRDQGGGELYFPPGYYKVEYGANPEPFDEFFLWVHDTPNLRMFGDSQLTTTLGFVHRLPSGGGQSYEEDKGVFVQNSPNFTMENLHLTSHAQIPDGAFRDNMANGLMIAEDSPGSRMNNLKISYFSRQGILVSTDAFLRSDDVEVSNCSFHNISASDASGDRSCNALFITTTSAEGEPDLYIRDVTVRGCKFFNIGTEGNQFTMAFYAGYIRNLDFYDNFIDGPSMPDGVTYQATGFNLYPEADQVRIHNNVIRETQMNLYSDVEVYDNTFTNCRNFRAVGRGSYYHGNTFVLDRAAGIPYLISMDEYGQGLERYTPIVFENNDFVGLNLMKVENAIRSTRTGTVHIRGNTFSGFWGPIKIFGASEGAFTIEDNDFHHNPCSGEAITILDSWPMLRNYVFRNRFYGFQKLFVDNTEDEVATEYEGNYHDSGCNN